MPEYATSVTLPYVQLTILLVFTKLASQLTASKLGELAIIPVIFLAQTLVSYLCSIGVSRLFAFKRRPRNFVVAMAVSCAVHTLLSSHSLTRLTTRYLVTQTRCRSPWSFRCQRPLKDCIGTEYQGTMTMRWQRAGSCISSSSNNWDNF